MVPRFCYLLRMSRGLPAASRTQPLTAALRALQSAAPAEETLGAFRILPRMLDLTGSVALAGALSAPMVHPRQLPTDGEQLWEECEGQLRELETRMAPVFSGTLPVSSHARMRRELRNPGLSMDGTHPGVRAIRAPFTRYVHGNVFDIRSTLQTLRLELAPKIAGMGEDAAQLEAVDAALRDATSRRDEILIARLLAFLDHAFAEAAKAELLVLPVQYEATDLEPWFLPDGWVPRYLKRVGDVLQALFLHEASLLRALVRSAVSGRTS